MQPISEFSQTKCSKCDNTATHTITIAKRKTPVCDGCFKVMSYLKARAVKERMAKLQNSYKALEADPASKNEYTKAIKELTL